ncbi:condensation domain-containing protein [Streptomyces sp. enrichment culture]|uniref:condensation domain-containing protein n=1 Tax=Streptomyces sp. enrichment culture TaxID=1795815 RepID=UPI003F54D03C
MTPRHLSNEPISVVVDPGRPPAPWDVGLHGPLDAAALEHLMGELTAEDTDRPSLQHRLLRHGPDRHTLRFSASQGALAALVAGRVADRLTQPPPAADLPLTPAQHAALTCPIGHRYEVLLVDTVVAPDAGALREALRAVVAAHPQLHSRLDAAEGWRTVEAGDGAVGGQDPLVEGEFADEAGFAALLETTGRTLDVYAGVQLRGLLARDRRPIGPRADRLAVVVHAVAVDAACRRALLDDLTAALGAAGGPVPVRPRSAPAGLADWIAELRELARDAVEAQHWALVAERRSRPADRRRVAGADGAAGYGEVAEGPVAVGAVALRRDAADGAGGGCGEGVAAGPVGGAEAGPGGAGGTATCEAPEAHEAPEAPEGAAGSGEVRRAGFVLEEEATERIAHGLARRLALTTGQVLTGVFALALARWQGTEAVAFDVRSDPRADRRGLGGHVGRLTEPYPVHLVLEPGLDALGQLTALADSLAVCAGRAGGGAGFGACREWSPDPSLRRALRELAPAQACLLLDDPDGTLPGSARPTHRLEVRAHVRDDRLSVGLAGVTDPADGLTGPAVGALARLLRELLEELADSPAARILPAFRATPQQSALYAGGDARPGTGRHVEQLVWAWHGPLDLARFTASWQSVYDCESVLRTAFTGGLEPQLVVHERVVPDIDRQVFHDGDWSALLERDRLRGFDLHRPGALRLTLLERKRVRSGTVAPTWILVTYHQALLDTRSAHILLREFYRAYLAGGTLPGGERRPDLRDYTAWVAAQDPEAAQGFWADSMPPDDAASRPGRDTAPTGRTGIGHARLRLDPVETTRLAHWAGTWGCAESSVVQAVWAMLIHEGSGADGPAPVRFDVTVSGRGILFDGAARMPGPLRNPLPMYVEVDPAATVPGLLRKLRDRALDMAAYEWVPGDWIRAWARRGFGGAADTVVVFEDAPHPVDGLEADLAAHGIGAEFPVTVPARSVPPIGLLAHHDSAGGLVLTGVYDRALFEEGTVAELLAQCAMLLRALSASAGEYTTVGEALKLLEDTAARRLAEVSGAGRDIPLVTLRAAGHEQAGTICLIPPPGAPATCYDRLSDLYPGPQELVVLLTDADGAQPALAAHGVGRSLLLGGFSGAGVLACDLAGRIAEDDGRPPRVVLAGTASDEHKGVRELARALREAVAADT